MFGPNTAALLLMYAISEVPSKINIAYLKNVPLKAKLLSIYKFTIIMSLSIFYETF